MISGLRAAEMRSDPLHVLKRGAHRQGPCGGKVIEVLRPAQFVDHLDTCQMSATALKTLFSLMVPSLPPSEDEPLSPTMYTINVLSASGRLATASSTRPNRTLCDGGGF